MFSCLYSVFFCVCVHLLLRCQWSMFRNVFVFISCSSCSMRTNRYGALPRFRTMRKFLQLRAPFVHPSDLRFLFFHSLLWFICFCFFTSRCYTHLGSMLRALRFLCDVAVDSGLLLFGIVMIELFFSIPSVRCQRHDLPCLLLNAWIFFCFIRFTSPSSLLPVSCAAVCSPFSSFSQASPLSHAAANVSRRICSRSHREPVEHRVQREETIDFVKVFIFFFFAHAVFTGSSVLFLLFCFLVAVARLFSLCFPRLWAFSCLFSCDVWRVFYVTFSCSRLTCACFFLLCKLCW